MYVVVVTSGLHDTEVFGPFQTIEEARFWEDRYLEAPEGATADFVKLVSPVEYSAHQWHSAVVKPTE